MLLGGSQILFYRASHKSIEKAYLNQMHNFDRQVSMELVNYYDQQVKNARFLAEHGTIIEAAKTGDFFEAEAMLSGFFSEQGNLENLFISTADEDTEILVDGVGGAAVGLHWAG
ncbi:MAG: hypothetical protein KAJ15_09705, partial [Spirochaetes bacterium]|nr:hypothetical protein [Spirochaetota bacterium]